MPNIKLMYVWCRYGLGNDPKSGVYLTELLACFNFCMRIQSEDLTMQANVFTPLLEGYITGINMKCSYEDRKKGGRLLKGVQYNSDELQSLSLIVNTGILTEEKTLTDAKEIAQKYNKECRKYAKDHEILL